MSQIETSLEELLLETKLEQRNLIVLNDDFNTFDHVIESLVKVVKHTRIQAEQCTLIVHYKGKCHVKTGSYSELEPMRTALLDRGITAEID